MKILIVEDETKLAQILQQGLKENGYIADWVGDGATGLEMALSGSYDAVILDVMLPAMDGFEVLSRIRKTRSTLPVMMLTARTNVDDRVRGLDFGADDYLSKPFDFKELLARLRAVTRRPQVEIRSKLTVADLELDSKSHEVRRGGKLIDLTPKEFGILEYLLSRKGLVLTRAMIMDHVWPSDSDYNGGSNLVEVYVNFLRKKIDQGQSVKLIQTIRGAGYMIQDHP
ncbi:response regulator transcription factor [Geothrix edaphica]|uniref:DNA-binding response regulator n=1 Tax=Geothrix edaphica TaxID=2927976 RepID=A0ABQ5PZL3_9BACT|nr:response regulator transcription factor [Geothrix edaphica]GLH67817.1 DNA-binding response regulator [Geothrix edaphica]